MTIKKNGEGVSDVRETILKAAEECLDAQLRAVRRLRLSPDGVKRRRVGRSQIDVAEAVLRAANQPLHVSEIIDRARRSLKVELDRESLVSALTKKVLRGDRFVRTGPNEFGLKPGR